MAFAYSVTLSDPGNQGGALDPLMITDLQAALADWSRYIAGAGTLVVQLVVDTTAVGRANGGATTVLTVGTAPGGATLVGESSVYELTTGQHYADTTSDITITVDPAYIAGLYLDPAPGTGNPIPGDRTDAISVFRHELGHGFGISGYYDQAGINPYGTGPGGYVTAFDTLIRQNPDGTADFIGPMAQAVFGAPVPITTDSSAGENYYHLADAYTDPNGQDLMNGQFFFFGTSYPISNIDLAILHDIGVPVTTLTDGPLPCFASGTRILTRRGDVAVEALRIGDIALLADGTSLPIRWLGHRRVACARHPRGWDVWPVRVRRDAFGKGRPHRDLLLSPDHALLVDAGDAAARALGDAAGRALGVLVPVRYLVNGATIVQEAVAEITYWHVELERHAVLFAEGLPAESYLDTGNRAAFANAAAPVQLHPDFARQDVSRHVWATQACARLETAGPNLVAARRRALRQAASLGYALTSDPDLRLLADGRAVSLVHADNAWHARLPQGTRQARLVSRSWVPAHARADEADTRRLGVALGRLWLDRRLVSLDSPGFGAGWHPPEHDWRWTDGDAVLNLAGVRELAFGLALAGSYWQPRKPRRDRRMA